MLAKPLLKYTSRFLMDLVGNVPFKRLITLQVYGDQENGDM